MFVSSQFSTFFFHETAVLCSVCRPTLGCFQGVSGVLVWVEGEASPFPLCGLGVWAFGTPLCIFSPDTSLHFDSLPNERLQQQHPMSYFVMSGNRWTSPKSWGCSWIFLFLSGNWGVRRWFFSAERARLQIHPVFQIYGKGQAFILPVKPLVNITIDK